jgi:hypothetical protein
VLRIGGGSWRFAYVPYTPASGGLFSSAASAEQSLVEIPLAPVIVVAVTAVLGAITLLVAHALY